MSKHSRHIIVFLAAFCLTGSRAFSIENSTRPNVLIVVVNCLSKSHLSPYGYTRTSTPNLDRFAQGAYVFKNLISPASFTPPVLHELFQAEPWDRNFYLGKGWDDWAPINTTESPVVRFLTQKGYIFFNDVLPDDVSSPFVSFLHLANLHYPYDHLRRREKQLNGPVKKLYKRLIKNIDEIELVQQPTDTERFPGLLAVQAFGVRRTELPINDDVMWDNLLKSLKTTGDSPAAVIAGSLPKALSLRLGLVATGKELTLQDKTAIVRALNSLTKAPDSPIQQIIFGPTVVFDQGNLKIGEATVTRWNWQFVSDIEWAMLEPNRIVSLKDGGRLILSSNLDAHQRLFLRQIYREALEFILPALSMHHPQHFFIDPPPDALKQWQALPEYGTEIALVRDLYDANIAVIDRQFGDALDRLRQLGVQNNTVVVFMGDHGEGFMERGFLEHGIAKCYDDEISPPLIIRVPGRSQKTVAVDAQLRIADIFPTLIDLLGFRPPVSSTGSAGVSLAAAMDGGPKPNTVAYSRNYSSSRSIRRADGWKLIWEMGANTRELYNWKDDPGETKNVAEDFPKITAELEDQLKRFLFGD